MILLRSFAWRQLVPNSFLDGLPCVTRPLDNERSVCLVRFKDEKTCFLREVVDQVCLIQVRNEKMFAFW